MEIRRLGYDDRELARALFVLMAQVFEEEHEALGDAYLERLLSRPDFWALAAFEGNQLVAGVTAYTLPDTKHESSMLFLYDIAVRPEQQRRGIGRALVLALRSLAAGQRIDDVFVLADNEDTHALDFYRALPAAPTAVTMFSFARDE